MTADIDIYLGGAVYATFDGYGIWLKANHHETPTDQVYVDPDVFKKLIQFAKETGVIEDE